MLSLLASEVDNSSQIHSPLLGDKVDIAIYRNCYFVVICMAHIYDIYNVKFHFDLFTREYEARYKAPQKKLLAPAD